VDPPSRRKFLGFSFTAGTEPRRRIAPQALVRFKSRVRELTRRTRGASLARIVEELSRYLVGWRGYFGFCETPSVLRRLDQWVRRRLRAIAWKQWKRGRTRFAELRRRGVGKDLAAQTAGSPHGPWRLSNSPALAIAIPNAVLDALGLAAIANPSAAEPIEPPCTDPYARWCGGVKPRGLPLSRLQASRAGRASSLDPR
jgi:RNA-directed DNA polymerase